MKSIFAKISAIVLVGIAMTGCVTNPSSPNANGYGYGNRAEQAYTVNYDLGVVNSVNVIQIAEKGSPGVTGAVVGGATGGVLGNKIGKGNGRKAATVAGVLLGGVVGSNVQANMNTVLVPYYELFVTLHNGQRMRILESTANQQFFVGQYVKVFQHPKTGHWRAVAD